MHQVISAGPFLYAFIQEVGGRGFTHSSPQSSFDNYTPWFEMAWYTMTMI